MDFRKLELNKLNVRAQKINLKSFIGEILEYFREEAQNKHIFLSLDADVSDVTVWADENMLEKIIFNLLSNAFKATKDNGMVSIKIQVPLKPIDFPLLNNEEEQYGIEIIIQDSGIGIDKKDLEHIFTRFYQSNEMDKQYYGGTGIGLEVVKSFVDLHKGNIEVKSKKNVKL